MPKCSHMPAEQERNAGSMSTGEAQRCYHQWPSRQLNRQSGKKSRNMYRTVAPKCDSSVPMERTWCKEVAAVIIKHHLQEDWQGVLTQGMPCDLQDVVAVTGPAHSWRCGGKPSASATRRTAASVRSFRARPQMAEIDEFSCCCHMRAETWSTAVLPMPSAPAKRQRKKTESERPSERYVVEVLCDRQPQPKKYPRKPD